MARIEQGRDAQDAQLPYVPLPRGLADPREEARTVFDGVANFYDIARPGYPARAIGDLAARCDLGPTSQILEIGCGTGQATRDLARTDAWIHCLEPGEHLAERARENLSANVNVKVTTTTFEAADEEPESYDAIVRLGAGGGAQADFPAMRFDQGRVAASAAMAELLG